MNGNNPEVKFVAVTVMPFGRGSVPEGYVGIRALLDSQETEKWFLVPVKEYDEWQSDPLHNGAPFVIDQSRHLIYDDGNLKKLQQARWARDDFVDYCPRCGSRHYAEKICLCCEHIF
jgi:hypothetical protein